MEESLAKFLHNRGVEIDELLNLLDEYVRNVHATTITNEDDLNQELEVFYKTEAVNAFRDELLSGE